MVSKSLVFMEERHIVETGIDWNATISVIEHAVRCIIKNDYAQPLKPYLRYRDMKNRIIAMPAFLGDTINVAGIKWIASFPANIRKGLPRAHSVVILNNADTGEPTAIIATTLLSVIRTASVSGLMIKHYDAIRHPDDITIGIVGMGPIGQYHLKMCLSLFGDRIARILLFDIRRIDRSVLDQDDRISIVDTWQEAYLDANIFITCTASDAPYIDKKPKAGSLHLNVSLRDYKTSVFEWFKDSIVVDDWDEVCREKTDVEMMHLEKGLQKEKTRSLADVIEGGLAEYPAEMPVIFNPMGMAVFDVAMGNYYYRAEVRKNAMDGVKEN